MDDAEEAEFIPWSRLVGEEGPQVPRLVYVGAAAVLALAVGLMLAPRFFPTEALVLSEAAAPTVATAAPTTLAEAPVVAAEPIAADLRLFRATAMAELFVHDYFTRDGDPNRADDLAAWGVEYSPTDTSVYVEWARAIEASEIETGWRVEVAFGSIAGSAAGSGDQFVREPIAVVRVELNRDEEVVGLPVLIEADLATDSRPGTIEPLDLVEAPVEMLIEFTETGDFAGEPIGAISRDDGLGLVVRRPGGELVLAP